MNSKEAIDRVADRVQDDFHAERRILSFDSWLELYLESPYLLSRSAAQYTADMLEFFGSEEIETAAGEVRRYKLFDLAHNDGRGRVYSQEVVQGRIFRLIKAAADEGRADKLILLHGPNGSGKSVLVEAIFRGLEHYSRQPEGALYRFNWVFPRTSATEKSLGFLSAPAEADESGSFATLTGEELSARLVSELKDHPIWLIPHPEREQILEQALERVPADRDRAFRFALEGELSQKCKGIYEGLLAGYQGNWRKLIRHVQVERLFLSQRFRQGAVTILPMANIDASEQQLTTDVSIQNLPAVLQNLKIFEPVGDLIDANGGVVEYGDFLKRPLDYNKYLLNAVEKGTINLQNSLVHLNLVMMGTSNEKHLDAFKATPEFTSFKGRIELVPVPYILEYAQEADLYRDMLAAVRGRVHAAPHVFELAGLFAVLTRLLRPDSERFEGRLGELVSELAPMEKALLYDHREAPERLEREDRQILLSAAGDIRDQSRDGVIYEGRFGASAREMRMVLTKAAFDVTDECLTPPLLLVALSKLVRDQTVYDFLKLQKSAGYHDPESFLKQLSERFARCVLEEIQESMDLISEADYDLRFDRYFVHVIAFNKGEKVENEQTGALDSPNEQIMCAVEDVVEFEEDRATFRQNLVARIGAFAVDHPNEPVDFRQLFPDLIRAVKREFFDQRTEKVKELLMDLVRDENDPPDDPELAATSLRNLVERKGYCEACARSAARYLYHHFPE